ncbi:MAG: ribonuclease H family protein [Christensenellaceae bacterium]|jgi:ribonuclease HI|nr:ribonuclease H family protein [Christensenellaceae bacterium]
MKKGKFYAVRKGHQKGIFYKWEDCLNATNGFSGAEYKSFVTEEEADAFLNYVDNVDESNRKFYAVKKGIHRGVFKTWPECQLAIKGYLHPEYKSFKTEIAAKAYLTGKDFIFENDIFPRLSLGKICIYTDGSFDNVTFFYSYGAVIVLSDSDTIELCGKGNNNEFLTSRNIAGEAFGVIVALWWAIKNKYDKVSIFHECPNLRQWASAEWSAKTPLSLYFQNFICQLKDIIDIEFVETKGHSDNKYNEIAHNLSRYAFIEETDDVLRDSDGFGINDINENELKVLLEELKKSKLRSK